MSPVTEAVAVTPPRARLPGTLRAARVAELVYALSALVLLSFVPFDDWGMVFPLVVEAVIGVAVFLGLRKPHRWAWLAAVAMAVYVLARALSAAARLVTVGVPTVPATVGAWLGIGWVIALQAIVLVACLLAHRRRHVRLGGSGG